jgi:hypothetical protein
MDLHAPEGPIRSLKDFATHLCVVTVGILIALGLEQLVEAHHRAQLGEEAVSGFRHELTDNRTQVTEVLDSLPKMREQVQRQVEQLSAAAGGGGGAVPSLMKYPGVSFDLVSVASWDTAVVTQGLAELPYDAVKRYSEAYGSMRVFMEEEKVMFDAWTEMHAFGEDPSQLAPEQKRALIERLRRYESLSVAVDTIGRTALRMSDAALMDAR